MELIWIGSAYLCGLIACKLSLPTLVGYLFAGYFLHYFNVPAISNLHHLSDIGIELLLFTVGLKLKPKGLLKFEVLTVGGAHLLITALVSGIFFVLLDEQITGGLVLGVSLAFSSTVFAIKVLEDSGELSSLHGRGVLSILILQDMLAIGLMAYAENKQPSIWAWSLLFMPLIRPLAHRLLSASRTAELKMLLGFTFATGGSLLAEASGINADVGALLAGLTIAGHAKTDELANRLWGIKELFLIGFFLQIGLAELPNKGQIYQAMTLLLLLPLQGVLFFALFILVRLRARTAFISSLALMTYSEFALITTSAVVEFGLLSAEWQSIISLAVAGSLAISAPLNKYADKLFVYFKPFLIRFERKSLHPDRLPDSFGASEWLIVGMGRTGVAAYQALIDQGQRAVGIDSDPTVIESTLAKKRRVVYADVAENQIWAELPLDKVKGIILTLPAYDLRINTIRQIRKNGFSGAIGSICYQVEDEITLKQAGADFIIHPLVEAGKQLVEKILFFSET